MFELKNIDKAEPWMLWITMIGFILVLGGFGYLGYLMYASNMADLDILEAHIRDKQIENYKRDCTYPEDIDWNKEVEVTWNLESGECTVLTGGKNEILLS